MNAMKLLKVGAVHELPLPSRVLSEANKLIFYEQRL